jgi:RND family efflux transporter MFP subunit
MSHPFNVVWTRECRAIVWKFSRNCSRGLLCGAALFLAFITGCKPTLPPPGPPEVQIVPVAQKDVPCFREWVGSCDGSTNASIRAQITGYVWRKAYQEGREVKRGDLLFEIDPRPFEAILSQAQANLSQAEAQQGKTQLDVNRYTPLAKEQAISQQELDDAVQANLAAKAQVLSCKAAVQQAQLNVDFTKITSLINGVAGIAKADVGDLVSPGGGDLATVSTMDPIKVNFFLSEQEYLYAVKRPDASGWREGGKGPDLQLLLADGSTYDHHGLIDAVDRQVDDKTGTIHLTALFPNPGKTKILRPGLFVRVRAMVGTLTGALVIPQRAVSELQGKYLVAVVGNDHKVSIRPVKVGERTGSDWVIEESLQAGEQVVVEGVQKAREGMIVVPKPYNATADQPSAEAQPSPGAKPQKP